ncbi:MAG TPA: hypothetical protein VEU47_19070 [Candidatus Cybelea sp.]|nr:hypothetical protein [Candidatus Cybelea sp.]
MSLSASQLIARCCAIAKAPGFTTQCGQYLNAVLEELAETYNFDVIKGTFISTFNTGLNGTFGAQGLFGSGPYPLPSDFLRFLPDDVFWYLQGVPYRMKPIDLAEFDMQVQQAGNLSFPFFLATDMSQTPPVAYVYPPPSGNFPFQGRYYRIPPDIATPESSASVPYFPMQTYLLRRVSGELMAETGDDRMQTFLAEARSMLNDYLRIADDRLNRSQSIKLDRRRFGTSFDRLRTTKTIGWP